MLVWAKDSSADHTVKLNATFSTRKDVSHCPDLLSLPNAATNERLTYVQRRKRNANGNGEE